MPRPHPLALALFLALILLVTWLMNLVTFTTTLVEKVPYHAYWAHIVPSFFIGAVIALLPAFVLHRLLSRSLQIHLLTAILLALSAATLLALNFHAQKIPIQMLQMDFHYVTLQYGWPACVYNVPNDPTELHFHFESWLTPVWHPSALLGNLLVALALLSSLTLLSEFLLTRSQKVPK